MKWHHIYYDFSDDVTEVLRELCSQGIKPEQIKLNSSAIFYQSEEQIIEPDFFIKTPKQNNDK